MEFVLGIPLTLSEDSENLLVCFVDSSYVACLEVCVGGGGCFLYEAGCCGGLCSREGASGEASASCDLDPLMILRW